MLRVLDLIFFAIERIRQHLLLVIWVLVGISVAVTLTLSLPLYVDAVYTGILASRLPTPPYAYQFRYLGAWNGNISLQDTTAGDTAIQQQFADEIGLPVAHDVRYLSGGRWSVRQTETNLQLGSFPLSTLVGADSLLQIVAGEWPVQQPPEDMIPVLLPESMMFTNGIQVGDHLSIQRQGGTAQNAYAAALWRPINETDPGWIFPPHFFEQVILVTEDTLNHLLEGIEDPIDEADWYLVFDGSGLRTSEISHLLSDSRAAQSQVERALPGIRLTVSPDDELKAFNNEVQSLQQELFIIILPIGGLVLYFVSVVAGLLVNRQQSDDVKLRSRGMSRNAVLFVHILMWGLIVLSALVIALLLSPPLVQLIGRTVSFLDFSGITSVELIQITQQAVLLAIGAGIVTASSGLFLAWRITTKNINDLKQVSRRNDKTWWQRSYLDLLAVGLAVYVLYTLLQQGGISASVDSPFADPLTFIGPTLFSLGLILLFLRFLPIFLGILARLIGITGNVPMLMALRELNRSMSRYRGSLLMTAFTLSLAGFTASMASTLDQSLLDVVRYRVGTELAVITVADPQTESTQDATTGQITEEVTGFNAPPVLDILQLPEIDDASRIGRYESRMTLSGQRLSGLVLGVDRAGLAGVSLTREDFSSIPLSRMLNDLATNRTGVILSHKTAEEYNVQIGQEVRYQVNVLGEWQAEIRATVVGFMDYFPTIDPQTMDYFLITSLDPIFEVAGTPLPFDVWLHVKAGVSLDQAEKAIRDVGFPVLRFADPHTLLLEAQAEPGRRGVLGFLSVGFLAAVSLTLIGTVIQGTASFQAQSSQLGSLRAMGMSSLSVRIYVLLLQGLIAISGVGSGTLIGLATTLLFLPLFDFSGGLPPYQLRIAWGDIQIVYSVFGTILILLALMMAFVLTRQQLAKAVKLGNI